MKLLTKLLILLVLVGSNISTLSAQDSHFFAMKDGKLIIETEEMEETGGSYIGEYSEKFNGMAYFANDDYTQTNFTVENDGLLDYTIKVLGCSDSTVAATIELYIDDALVKTLTWSSNTPKEEISYCRLSNKTTHSIKLLLVGDVGQSDVFIDKITIVPKNAKIRFTSPLEETKVYADSMFKVSWESSGEEKDPYTLNWTNTSDMSTIVLKDSVSAPDFYSTIIPPYYEGATGYYTITKKADELIPSDFDEKKHTVNNPLIWADVPDPSVVRVGDTYYMASTTMHMSPGVPIMASKDLVRWRTINYAHGALINNDAMNLSNGKDAYGKGSWASCIRYKDGTFYVLTPSYTSNRTHLYKTTDIENGPWTETTLPFYHDPSLLLDDDGRVYVIYGNTDIHIIELTVDGSAVKAGGVNKVLLSDPSSIAGSNFYVKSEGAHIEKINGQYYVFLISWPAGNCRTELVYRSATLTGQYEGKIALQDQGVAQGGIFDTPNGDWYAMLFQDAGSVGRIPYLIPVYWANGWPMFGVNGKVPASLQMDAAQEDGYGLVSSDEFDEDDLIKEWQWNHNPDVKNWSLTARSSHLRLTNNRIDAKVVDTKNTLTQRTFGPTCSAWTVLDTKGMKDGDYAGLCAFQAKYGFVGAKVSGNTKYIVMVNASSDSPQEVKSIALTQDKIWLRIDMNYQNRADKAIFYYSLDGNKWELIGNTLSMSYTMPHFTGYRYGLFNFGTKNMGGYADFDFFKIGSSINQSINLHMNKKEEIIATSATITILSKESVGIENSNPSEMRCTLFPNPASHYINIIGAHELRKIDILDINGKCIQTTMSAPFSIQDLNDGIYFIRIYDENGILTKPIEIKR